MEQRVIRVVGFVFVLSGLFIVVHHVWVCGRLFDLGDILHHEFFEAILFTAGIVLLLTSLMKKQ
jgi:hypothetical protein